MELAKHYFSSTDIVIFKQYGLYHLAIELPHENLCIESYCNPSFQELLALMQKSIIEAEDEFGKLSIHEEAIMGVFSSMKELENHLIKEMESAQLTA